MDKITTRIIWNGQGGELDCKTIPYRADDDQAVARALAQMVTGQIVNPGDSFKIESVD